MKCITCGKEFKQGDTHKRGTLKTGYWKEPCRENQRSLFVEGDKVKYAGEELIINGFEVMGNQAGAKFENRPGLWIGLGALEFVLEGECKNMNIKINRKSPMTDAGQREAFKKLFDNLNRIDVFGISLNGYLDRAMEICKNDPQEIKSIEITIPFKQAHIDPFPGVAFVMLTYDQYKQIKQAVER